MKYYLFDGEKETGPFEKTELESITLVPETPVWHEGLETWTTAENVAEIAGFLKKPEVKPPPFKKPGTPPIFRREDTTIQETEGYENQYQQAFPDKKGNTKKYWVIGIILSLLFSRIIYKVGVTNYWWDSWGSSDNYSTIPEPVSSSFVDESKNIEQVKRDGENARLTERNRGYRNNWNNYVQASAGYNANKAFGGISDCYVEVRNRMPFRVDRVVVLLEYVKKNGESAQTETASIFNIPANETGSVVAPSSNRGVSVNVSIEEITSGELHFCFPAGTGGNNDPFFCR